MSFEVEYNQDGTVKSMEPSTLQPEEQAPEQMVENSEQELEIASIEPEEAVEEDNEPDVQAPSKKQVKNSWDDLREKAYRAEKRAQELEEQLNARHSKKVVEPEENYDLDIEEDSLVEGRHLSKVEKKLKAMEAKLNQYEQQSSHREIENKLKSQYADFDEVVSAKNIERLSQDYPELAETLRSNGNLYSAGKSAYILIKQLGFTPKDQQASSNRMKALSNIAKPQPTASIKPGHRESPLSKASSFYDGGDLSKDMQKSLIKQMEDAINNLGVME